MSSSWHDAGVDDLTDGDEVTGETDTYSWNDFNSVTDGLTETETVSSSYSPLTPSVHHDHNRDGDPFPGRRWTCFSLTDAGTETLDLDIGSRQLDPRPARPMDS